VGTRKLLGGVRQNADRTERTARRRRPTSLALLEPPMTRASLHWSSRFRRDVASKDFGLWTRRVSKVMLVTKCARARSSSVGVPKLGLAMADGGGTQKGAS
jgi:hypothetical protein